MKLLSLFLMLAVRSCICRNVSAHNSKLYFQLLKSEDQMPPKRHTVSPQETTTDQILSTKQPLTDGAPPEIARNPNDPQPRDLNSTHLYQLLGNRFDSEYMSVSDPTTRTDTTLIQLVHGRPKGHRPDYLNTLRTAKFQGGSNIKLNVSKQNRVKFEKFLWSYTACPLRQTWKNMGVRFWPPWIKEGSCVCERSCSFPPGMMCKANAYTIKVILRWECASPGHLCRWRMFPYRIFTSCACAL